MIDPIPTFCPRCAAPMTRVVSGRYDVCQVCPKVRGVHVYVPVGDAPPHWMDGTAVGEGLFDAKMATKSGKGGVMTTPPSSGRRPRRRAS